MQSAKAYAGAVTAIIVFGVAQVGLELPASVVGALELVVTGGIVWLVKNRTPKEN